MDILEERVTAQYTSERNGIRLTTTITRIYLDGILIAEEIETEQVIILGYDPF